MYHFDKPIKKIAAEIRKLADSLKIDNIPLTRKRSKEYAIYVSDVPYPIGTLYVTCGLNDYYSDPYITVKAELFDDKGRNNTIGIEDQTTDGIAFAIGFTCGTAMFRQPRYQNH